MDVPMLRVFPRDVRPEGPWMFARRKSQGWTTTERVAFAAFLGQLYFYLPAATPYLLARDLSLTQINSLQTVLILSQLLLEVPTGIVADRFGRRWSLILAAAFLAVAETGFLFARDYPTFVLVQIVTGLSFALASGSRDALVYESLPPDNRTERMHRANGLIGAATQTGNLLAFAAGGVLVASLTVGRISAAIVLTILMLIAALVATATIREPKTSSGSAHPRAMIAMLLDGIGLLRQNPGLRRIVLLALLTQSFGAYLLLLYQAYFLDLEVPGVWFGLALAIGSGLGIAGQRYAYLLPRKLGARRGVLLATIVPGPLYLLMAVTTHPALAVALFCLLWGAILVAPPLLSGYTNALIPDGYRATALSLISLLVSIYLVVMGPLLGAIADRSVAASFALMGALVLAGALTIRIDDVA